MVSRMSPLGGQFCNQSFQPLYFLHHHLQIRKIDFIYDDCVLRIFTIVLFLHIILVNDQTTIILLDSILLQYKQIKVMI